MPSTLEEVCFHTLFINSYFTERLRAEETAESEIGEQAIPMPATTDFYGQQNIDVGPLSALRTNVMCAPASSAADCQVLQMLLTAEGYRVLQKRAELMLEAGFKEIIATSKWYRYNVIRQRTTTCAKEAAMSVYAILCLDIIKQATDDSLGAFIRSTRGRPSLNEVTIAQVAEWLCKGLHSELLLSILPTVVLQQEWQNSFFGPRSIAELTEEDHVLQLTPSACMSMVWQLHNVQRIEELVRFRLKRSSYRCVSTLLLMQLNFTARLTTAQVLNAILHPATATNFIRPCELYRKWQFNDTRMTKKPNTSQTLSFSISPGIQGKCDVS